MRTHTDKCGVCNLSRYLTWDAKFDSTNKPGGVLESLRIKPLENWSWKKMTLLMQTSGM